MNTHFIYITTSDTAEAEKIGTRLVEEQLVACVNIVSPMKSIYRWKGKIETATEVVLLAKTTEDRVKTLISRVKELHSYEIPCIVALPVTDGNPDFLKWVETETHLKK